VVVENAPCPVIFPAGAPRIIGSLWKVDDQATSEFMERFYQGMLRPEALRPAGALRQVQLSIWKQ
jgi:CHAT domain-containing protein